MKLKYIVAALNMWLKCTHPDIEGFLIGKESIEPTTINAYKVYKVEIYYHTLNDNKKVYTLNMVDRCLSGEEDKLKEKYSTTLLGELFINLKQLENEII